MNSIRKYGQIVAVFFVLLSAGCGDHGGGYWAGGIQSAKTAVVFKTELKTGYNDQIGSINVTVELPGGVTVSADSSGWIPQSALYLSGEGALFAAIPNTTAILLGKFTPATQTSKAKVSLAFSGLVNSGGPITGLSPGEFATLICDVAPGTSFPSTTFLPLSGVDIANSLATLPHLSDTSPPLAWITYQIIP
jgi:hypothetical protein